MNAPFFLGGGEKSRTSQPEPFIRVRRYLELAEIFFAFSYLGKKCEIFFMRQTISLKFPFPWCPEVETRGFPKSKKYFLNFNPQNIFKLCSSLVQRVTTNVKFFLPKTPIKSNEFRRGLLFQLS